MDFKLNKEKGPKAGVVSEAFSPVTVAVIPTNEELQIAIDVYELAFGGDEEFRRRQTDVIVGFKG
jgi:acetate kinase